MNLQKLIAHKDCRFKTPGEMYHEYGPYYMDIIMDIEPNEVLTVMSLYGGKKFYPIHFRQNILINKDYFVYGHIENVMHVSMLTTKSFPKWSFHAERLKPGMIVTIINTDVSITSHIPSHFRNMPGITTCILKVNNAIKHYAPTIQCNRINSLDDACVAVELIKPISRFDPYGNNTKAWTKDMIPLAFEMSWHLRLATKDEKLEYYKYKCTIADIYRG